MVMEWTRILQIISPGQMGPLFLGGNTPIECGIVKLPAGRLRKKHPRGRRNADGSGNLWEQINDPAINGVYRQKKRPFDRVK